MIIIPEIETIAILVPRTGSGSLKEALLARYPQSFLLYRHMEADGIPHAYDRWGKVGVVRNPLDRLWSLYKFCQPAKDGGSYSLYPAMWERQNKAVDRPFEDWLLNNEMPFTSGYDSAEGERFWPQFSVLHALPENRKSQFLYLRPDLGTEILQYADTASIEQRFDIVLGRKNHTDGSQAPISPAILEHLVRFHSWDLEAVQCAS